MADQEVSQFDSRVAEVETQLWRALRSYGVSSLVSSGSSSVSSRGEVEGQGEGGQSTPCVGDDVSGTDDMGRSCRIIYYGYVRIII